MRLSDDPVERSRPGSAAPSRAAEQAVSLAAIQTLLAEMNPDALEAAGNDETADIVRQALVALGRHIAHELGPKGAGAAVQ